MTISRLFFASVSLIAVITLGSCIGSPEPQAQREADANSAAGKVGKAAHTIAKDAGKISEAAGRKLAKAAHQAKEGWNEAARDDQAKGKK